MSTWAERVHRGAVSFGHVVTSCGHPNMPYPRRIDKVKFGVGLDEVCKNDIPGSLLVLILKLNKEAPVKKDVFRAPGHLANMKKLIHFLQAGRLVNIDNFSVYTIASVLKKFLRKLPDGIFGRDGERELFDIIQLESIEDQKERIHRLVVSLPLYTQRLLVLLFGTFRVIAANADRAQTGMTSEALGVSVAPSFFHTCVSDGRQACMQDVQRFKVATRIMKLMIDNFGGLNLFGRENYEYYARITGRILKVDDDWIFSFRYPRDSLHSPLSQQEESVSTPALIHVPEPLTDGASSSNGTPGAALGIIPENTLLTTDSYTRLSTSLEENGLYKGSSSRSSCSSTSHHITMEELRAGNLYAESTKSLTFLPQHNSSYGLLPELQSVHERQTERMRTRSEWFLTPLSPGQHYSLDEDRAGLYYPMPLLQHSNASSQEIAQQRRGLARRLSRHRSSGKRNKENGSKKWKKSSGAAAAATPEMDVVGNILANLAYPPELQRKCQKISPCQPHN